MKYACKACKRILSKDECPVCGKAKVTKDWKGRIYVVNPEKSELAKKTRISNAGEYAIRV